MNGGISLMVTQQNTLKGMYNEQPSATNEASQE